MEVEQQQPDNIKLTSTMETDTQENLTEDEQYNFNKTIEVENSSLKALSSENSENISNETATENGKKKVKEEKPPSKIVVRRLPPTMSKEQFVEQVSPLPEVDYMCFVQGNINDNVNPFSRVYLSFVNQEDLFSFSNTFDNYVFLDAKGQEYPAVVEFNMVQRFPKQRNKKKDPLMGTIESDPAWISFKENLLAEALENSKTQSGKATKQHYFETEISTAEEVNTTPLLEYIKVRRAEKARVREERKEEKKRKELERKLKQKTKEKKGEGEEEESTKDVKVLISKDKERKDLKDKERGTKKKDEKDKVKEPRIREFKSRGGKSYQEERLKLAERREEKKREMLNTGEKKSEQVEPSEMNEPRLADTTKCIEDKPVKIEKKRYERKGKYDNEEWKEEKKRLRNEKANSKREGRKEEYTRRHHEKRNSDLDLRRKGKNYKVSDSLKVDKRKSRDQFEQENKISEKNKEEDDSKRKSRSFDDLNLITSEDFKQEGSSEKSSSKEKKRSNSLENLKPGNIDNSRIIEIENLIVSKKGKVQSRDSSKQTENSHFRSRKDRSKNSEGKPLSSKSKEKCDEKGEDRDEEGGNNRNPEGGGEQEKKEGGKASSRPDKRIRNKDRPSIEIYRPGMGKFSKQRLEKEKALGSSTEVESPSHSPSPTPKSKLIT